MILTDIAPHLLHTFKSESELIGSIQKVSDNFTKNREKLGDYLKVEKLVSAYTAFYLTTNFPKWNEVLSKIGMNSLDISDYELIDIGSGPGTFTFAQLANNPQQKIFALESAHLMREQFKKILNGLYPDADVFICENQREIPQKLKTRLGVFGHSANEMTVEEILTLIQKLDLDHILFIEPGTKAYFEKSLAVRESLFRDSYSILYPCGGQSKCPLSDKDDWCHQFLYIKQHPEIERICQIVKKDRKLLPQTIHYYAKNHSVEKQKTNRVIRVYRPTKFGIEMQICHAPDGENKVFDLQQLSRSKSKSEMKTLQKILAGDQVKFTTVRELENNKVRGEIEL